ncbi:S1 family peptidase [Streptomyces sp. NPDC046261]|uniref:S1 family peptidase n=1 Tax=Streptomyces sp. NPDC046261 TaxID=3157200 RepID=UPI003405FBD0
MKSFRVSVRAVLTGVAVAALTAVSLAPQQVQAAAGPVPATLSPLSPVSAQRLAASLADRLQGSAAGSYYDEGAGALVVNVIDRTAENIVRAAGARPQRARFTQARLDSALLALNERAAIPGTAWVQDPRVNRVVVTADPTVTGAKRARLDKVVSDLGESVTVRRISTRLTRFIEGGDAVWGPTARCSLGFNVKRAGKPDGFLTAGHCGNAVTTWAATRGGPQIARTEASTFPGSDHAIAGYTATTDAPGTVRLHNGSSQRITSAGTASVGEAVQRSGYTTGLHSGKVTGLDATVNYEQGQVRGLIQTDVCAEPGDSGGPLFDGPKALGLLSGGSGNCGLLSGPKVTYYQPVRPALDAYGATLG